MPARSMNRSTRSRNRSSKNRSAQARLAGRSGAIASRSPWTSVIRPMSAHPVGREAAQIRVVPAAVAGQVGVAGQAEAGIGQVGRSRHRRPELVAPTRETGEPAEDVAAPVPPREAPGRPDGQDDRPPCREQLLGDLDAGLPGSDDEHRAGRERHGVPVVVRVDLGDPCRQGRADRRDPRVVEAPDRDDDLASIDRSIARLEPQAVDSRDEPADRGLERQRRLDPGGVIGHPRGDLVARHVAVRLRPVVRRVGERDGPVRTDEPERVPAVEPPAAESAAPVDHEVLATRRPQSMAHRQAGLARPDDDRIHLPHDVPLLPAHCVRPPTWRPAPVNQTTPLDRRASPASQAQSRRRPRRGALPDRPASASGATVSTGLAPLAVPSPSRRTQTGAPASDTSRGGTVRTPAVAASLCRRATPSPDRIRA